MFENFRLECDDQIMQNCLKQTVYSIKKIGTANVINTDISRTNFGALNNSIEQIEEAIRDVEAGEDKISELEIMQALDFVGFNLFRDNWQEYKKMDMMNRDQSQSTNFGKDKRLLN